MTLAWDSICTPQLHPESPAWPFVWLDPKWSDYGDWEHGGVAEGGGGGARGTMTQVVTSQRFPDPRRLCCVLSVCFAKCDVPSQNLTSFHLEKHCAMPGRPVPFMKWIASGHRWPGVSCLASTGIAFNVKCRISSLDEPYSQESP